jgi:hypothetical protein
VEFRDRMQDALHWYKITDQLVRGCRTTIGYLIPGHQALFFLQNYIQKININR